MDNSGTAPSEGSKARLRTPVERICYRPKEVAAAAGLSLATVYAHMKSGDLPARILKGATVILADDLRDYLRGLPTYTEVNGKAA